METLGSQISHWLSTGGVFAILAILIKQHTVWTRMKDRINVLWHKHCREKGERFVPLDNGKY
jgi:hypothetical protein